MEQVSSPRGEFPCWDEVYAAVQLHLCDTEDGVAAFLEDVADVILLSLLVFAGDLLCVEGNVGGYAVFVLGGGGEAFFGLMDGDPHVNLSFCGFFGENPFEGLVEVAEEGGAWRENYFLGGGDDIPRGHVGSEAMEFSILVDEAESVPVGERFVCPHDDLSALRVGGANLLSDGFRSVGLDDVPASSVKEIVGRPSMETFVRVGGEGVGAVP